MKKQLFLSLLLIASTAIWFGCKEEETTGSIAGIVTDKATGEPIKNAGVELKPSGKQTVTGSDGQFEFVEVEIGEYTILVTKTGYNDGESNKIQVNAGQTSHCDIQIEKLPPALKVIDGEGDEINEIDFGEETDVRMKTFGIFNNGTQTLEWEIFWTAEWIEDISKTSGLLSAGNTQLLIIKIDRSLLQSGMNTTTINIASNDGGKQLTIKAVNGTIPATLNTLPATDITTTTAKLNGVITEPGYPSYTERGFVYAQMSMPTLENTIHRLTAAVNEDSTYSAIATGLALEQTYYVRAYAINAAGTAYSTNQVTVIPAYVLPDVSTDDITNRNMAAGSATFNGTINSIGDPAYTERGFAYGTTHNPSVDDMKKVVSGSGLGAFSANVSGLQIGTTYYIRAYAKNDGGYAYGSEQSLNFNSSAPSVTTQNPTNINKNNGTATFNGTVTDAGDPAYNERGFAYGTSRNPNIDDDTKKVVSGNGTGAFSANITDLQVGQTYYIRAYAKNEGSNTAYGEEITLDFSAVPPSVTTQSVTNINKSNGTATFNGSITNVGDPTYTEKGFTYGTTHNPTIDSNLKKIVTGHETGAFFANITDLEVGNIFYIRAYARQEGQSPVYGTEKTLNFTADEAIVTTSAPTNVNIGNGTATFNGNVTNAGDPPYTEKGFVYGTTHNPNVTDNTKKTVEGNGTGTYSANVANLTGGTIYYVRAYVINAGTAHYGNEEELDFSFVPAAVTTSAPTNINIGNGTATFNGNVTNVGDPTYTERGFVYGTTHNPNVTDNMKKIAEGSGAGAYSANVTNLEMGLVYYVRAYVINAGAAHYGAEQTLDFTAVPAAVTTSAPTNKNIGNGTATFNGSITSIGDPAYTEKGFVYATTHNPNIEDNTRKTVAGSGIGAYSVSVNNLVMGNTYYIRAYVINAGVTRYGAEQMLDFNAVPPTVTIQAATNVLISNGNSVSATLNATITYVGDPAYTERGFVYGTMTTPTIYDATVATVAGTETGSFSKQVTGLSLGKYNVRAYAKNGAGDVAYSDTISIETAKLCMGCGPGGVNLYVAIDDAPGEFTWGPYGVTTNATNTNDGMINMNTIKALDASLNSYPAFKTCNDMGDGWYLPSKNELISLYEHRSTLGDFCVPYWSSTEGNAEGGLYVEFRNGNWAGISKRSECFVRCVRRVE